MSVEQSLKNSFTIYGVIVVLQGLSMLLFPHLTMSLLHLSPLQTAQAVQYARLAGLVLSVIGYFYVVAGICTLIGFYRASVIGRLFVLPGIAAMIYFWSFEIPFLIFGIQDLVTSIWSYTCLKAYDEQQAKIKK